jgi:glyceraldehyde 3-phosphate dehydrogenase
VPRVDETYHLRHGLRNKHLRTDFDRQLNGMNTKTKIFINGFGRIGRTVLRAILKTERQSDFEILGINDLEGPDICAYLLEYDSIYGTLGLPTNYRNGMLQVGNMQIPFYNTDDISGLDLSEVEVLLECSGHNSNRQFLERGLAAGAKSVLVSGPSSSADAKFVYGVNEQEFVKQKIVSNSSCTTNAFAPLLKFLNQNFGVIFGNMLTVHCYTGSQPTIDKPGRDPARSRAAGLSMVPTTTSAELEVRSLLPELADKVLVNALRVPTPSVSAIDFSFRTEKPFSSAALYNLLREHPTLHTIIGFTGKPLVSSDLKARPESLVISMLETAGSNKGLNRVFGWYDNEYGFSNRMLDMCQLIEEVSH